jgi:hypothetical protein
MKIIIIALYLLSSININSDVFFIKLDDKNIKDHIELKPAYVNGWSASGLNEETGTLYDSDGWSKEGINKDTLTEYDSEGYNKSGYDNQGLGINYKPLFENVARASGTATVYSLIVGYQYQSGGSPAQKNSVAFYGGGVGFSYPNSEKLSEDFIKEDFPSYISFYSLKSNQTRNYTDSNGQKYIIRTKGVNKTHVSGTQTQYNSSGVLVRYNVYKHQGTVEIQKVL